MCIRKMRSYAGAGPRKSKMLHNTAIRRYKRKGEPGHKNDSVLPSVLYEICFRRRKTHRQKRSAKTLSLSSSYFYTLIEQSFQMSSVKLITLSAELTSQFCTAVFLDNIADLCFPD